MLLASSLPAQPSFALYSSLPVDTNNRSLVSLRLAEDVSPIGFLSERFFLQFVQAVFDRRVYFFSLRLSLDFLQFGRRR
ncbi:hypothetical protein D1872_228760 [compost metagenome]